MKKLHSTHFVSYLNMILLFSITLHCLQLITTADALSNETDRLALLKFKESINNDPHGILSSWNNSIHFCSWDGIKCSRRHQRVTALELSGRNLRGTISPFIGNLSFLGFFSLQANKFYGKIPQEVGHLFRLQHLDIGDNALEGEIPVNLINCSNLRLMNISVNKFSGKIPEELSSFVKLEMLELAKNNLTGSIPPSLGNLSSLQFFSAAVNNLVGNIPEDIGHLKSLSFFSLALNRLSGMIPSSIYNISSISIFSMTENEFNGTLPTNIGLTLPNLQVLNVGGNKFSGPIPISLANASQLQDLDMPSNSFVGQVPTNMRNLIGLYWLNLASNSLGSNSAKDLDFITSLKNCSQLEILDFSTNQFGGVLPNSIANLSTQLTKLRFGGNQISGIIPAVFENFINLTFLAMDNNLFAGIIPTYFGKLQKMQALFLDNNNLSGTIPSSIGNLTQLVQLDLSQNKLEGNIPPNIGNCQNLQIMEISHNELSGAIPQQVIGLSSLLELSLSYNSLSGTLSAKVENLKNIYILDVSENNLSGEVPKAIENCMSLEYLYLQGNSFQGTIPASLASLKGLQYLDLSRNNVSGQIPKDLKKLRVLLFLNLSFNNLEGEVPMEGVFGNASAISVIRNHNLCGGIPELQLPTCPIKLTERRKSHHAFKLTIIIVSVVLCLLLILSFLALYWIRKSKKKASSTFSTMELLSKVSYKSLYQATGGFSSSNLIGSGGFGSVYKGILGEEDRVVAVKVLNLQQKGATKSFMAECNALRTIRHRNLVKILTCCSSMDYNRNEFKALVFEFMTNESLDKWLYRENDFEIQERNLNLLQRLNIAIDIASALDYLHHHSEQPVIHCDLKPSNVLLDNDMVAHVSDFGLARLLSTSNDSSQKQTSTIGIKGSIGYAAPEYGMGGEASTEGDVYSYGILVLEMFTGRRPTDEMFKDGLNLHNFTKMALPERLVQIVDPTLRIREVEETTTVATMRGARAEDNIDSEIGADEETSNTENLSQINANVHKCLLSLLEVGLACSVESPKERMNMGEVTKELHLIKNVFLVSGIRRGRPKRTQVRGA